jgi:hypothetical protein
MTNQQIQQQIDALLEERRGYEVRLTEADSDTKKALTERIAAVNDSLAKAGYKSEKAAAKPADKAPAAPAKAPAAKKPTVTKKTGKKGSR